METVKSGIVLVKYEFYCDYNARNLCKLELERDFHEHS